MMSCGVDRSASLRTLGPPPLSDWPLPRPVPRRPAAADAKTRIREVTPAQAHEEQSQGAVLIDVRESEEFAQGSAKGAIHLSKGLIELHIEQAVPDVSTHIICYCGGGMRSALAADNLQKMGYTNVASMSGGMKGWRNEGLPME
jgi:rhodanese-related sulfurtransferase